MLWVPDEVVVELVCLHELLTMLTVQQLQELPLKHLVVAVQICTGDTLQRLQMVCRPTMHSEPVLVPTLPLAWLAEEAQFLGSPESLAPLERHPSLWFVELSICTFRFVATTTTTTNSSIPPLCLDGVMSQLQQLALSRASRNNKNRSAESTDSALQSLQLKGLNKLNSTASTTTSGKLGLLSSKIGKSAHNGSSNTSLSGKLQSLRLQRTKQQQNTLPETKEIPDTTKKIPDTQTVQNVRHTSSLDKWEQLQSYQNTTGVPVSHTKTRYLNLVPFHKYKNNLSTATNNKLFSIYRPKQKDAFHSFNKPSPDDVILLAQDKVFTQTTKDLNKLDLNGKQIIDTPTPVEINENLSFHNLNCVVLGHKHSGKSTLVGALIQHLHLVNIDDIRQLKNKYQKFILKTTNTTTTTTTTTTHDSNWLAWLTDLTESERSNGYSLNSNRIKLPLDTKKNHFLNLTIANNNNTNLQMQQFNKLISALNSSHFAIMVIDCSQDSFETGFNLNGSTIQHSILAKFCNIDKLYIMLNKLDTLDWYHERFIEIYQQLSLFYQDLGFQKDQLFFIPCCSINGMGITTPFDKNLINWYTGPTLWQYLQREPIPVLRTGNLVSDPISLYIDQINKNNNIIAHLNTGIIRKNQIVKIYPINSKFIIKSIKVINHTNIYNFKLPAIARQWAVPNEIVSLNLQPWPPSEQTPDILSTKLQIGNLITQPETDVVVWEGKLIKLEILDQFNNGKLSISAKFNLTFIMGQMDCIVIKILKNLNDQMVECEIMNDDIDIPFIANWDKIGIIRQGKLTIAKVKLID